MNNYAAMVNLKSGFQCKISPPCVILSYYRKKSNSIYPSMIAGIDYIIVKWQELNTVRNLVNKRSP